MGLHVKIRVRTRGFKEGQARFGRAVSAFGDIVGASLQAFGQRQVDDFKTEVKAGAFGRTKGHPKLYDVGTYIESWTSRSEGVFLTIGPEGMNRHMSNYDLGEMLEYGWKGAPAIPHQRRFEIQVVAKLPELGKEIGDAISRRLGGT